MNQSWALESYDIRTNESAMSTRKLQRASMCINHAHSKFTAFVLMNRSSTPDIYYVHTNELVVNGQKVESKRASANE